MKDGAGFRYYVDYSRGFGRCPPGPKSVTVKSNFSCGKSGEGRSGSSCSSSGSGGKGTSVGELWALLFAMLALVVSISPHLEIQWVRYDIMLPHLKF